MGEDCGERRARGAARAFSRLAKDALRTASWSSYVFCEEERTGAAADGDSARLRVNARAHQCLQSSVLGQFDTHRSRSVIEMVTLRSKAHLEVIVVDLGLGEEGLHGTTQGCARRGHTRNDEAV